MKTEQEIRETTAELEKLSQAHGASPEIDGMLHALKWITDNVRPDPVKYARVIYGVEGEIA